MDSQQTTPSQATTPTNIDVPPAQPVPDATIPTTTPTNEPQSSSSMSFGVAQPYNLQPTTLPQPTDPHRVRNGVLWIIVGPILTLTILFIVSVIGTRVLLSSVTAGSGGTSLDEFGMIMNIVSFVNGILAIQLLAAGPIVGIVILTRK